MPIDPAPRRGRPMVSSREQLEASAFELLLRDGYEATTIQAIIAASGVGRSTFFRYFGSKAGVVWGEFDRAIESLRTALAATPDDVAVVTAVRLAVVEMNRISQRESPESWLDRFRVIDADPALAAEGAHHWSLWASEISDYVDRRTRSSAGSPLSASIGGAVQALYVAVLRRWSAAPAATVHLTELDDALRVVCDALEVILPAAREPS